MNKNLDIRIRKTYTGLMHAFLDLISEKNFEDITVNELCTKAMVGRGTFYKHFTDKYDFFTFLLNEMFDHYIEEAEQESNVDSPISYYTAFFTAFTRYMDKNREIFGPLTSNSMTAVMLFSTSDKVAGKLEAHLNQDIANGHPLIISATSAARFLTGAMAQSARYLVAHPDTARLDDLTADMETLINKLYEA